MKTVALWTICSLTLLCSNLHAQDLRVELRQVGPHTWTHTAYETINGYRTDSNGMIVECAGGLVLVDTCWNDSQTQVLLQKIKQTFTTNVVLAVITHSHVDRIGGIRTLLSNGIKVVSTQATAAAAVAAGYPAPSPELRIETTILRIGDTEIEAYYPGEGHTKDNIVVWVPSDRVLFGGCLVKSLQSPNLGNIAPRR